MDGQTIRPLSVLSRKSNTSNGRSNVSSVFVSGAKLLQNVDKALWCRQKDGKREENCNWPRRIEADEKAVQDVQNNTNDGRIQWDEIFRKVSCLNKRTRMTFGRIIAWASMADLIRIYNIIIYTRFKYLIAIMINRVADPLVLLRRTGTLFLFNLLFSFFCFVHLSGRISKFLLARLIGNLLISSVGSYKAQ